MFANHGVPKRSQRRTNTHIWNLVTNHQNMLYMLAAGMVMGPAGFRGKHYCDSLSTVPGWIPLFRYRNREVSYIPADVLTQATSERKHLLPCIASFDLSPMSGRVRMLRRDGSERTLDSPLNRKGRDDIAILVRAPLPLTTLSRITFRSTADRQAFEAAAGTVSNVDLAPHQLDVDETLFSTTTDVAWPPRKQQERSLIAADDDAPPALGQAVGGMLAMLYYTANRSDLGMAVYRLVAGVADASDNDRVHQDVILAELPGWLMGQAISGEVDIRARLFWGVVESLVAMQMEQQPQQAVDVALAYLEDQLGQLKEDRFRERLRGLIADMGNCYGLGYGTITELLERQKGTLSRSLLLFCLREHCMEMLEFSHPLLSDVEYVVAGILFGVRDGWLKLPRELRDPQLASFASWRMAGVEHRRLGDRVSLETPPHPRPLREALVSQDGKSNGVQRQVALELASRCHWNECIRTRITLMNGDYPESFAREGWQVVLPGRIRELNEEAEVDAVLRRLRGRPWIAPEIEAEVRKRWVESQESGGMGRESVDNANDPQPTAVH